MVTSCLPLSSLFLGVAKQRSHFSCHSQVKWLHLLLSSHHKLLWCDPLLEQTAHISSAFSLPPWRHCLAPELLLFCFSVGCSMSARSPPSFPSLHCMQACSGQDGGRQGGAVFLAADSHGFSWMIFSPLLKMDAFGVQVGSPPCKSNHVN